MSSRCVLPVILLGLAIVGAAHGETPGKNAASGWHFPPAGQDKALHDPQSPAEVGLDPRVVSEINDYIADNPYTARRVQARWALWRHGRLVHVEGDFHQTVDVASLRKTWHAMMVGAALLQGRIPSLDQKISTWVDDLEGNDADATWRHIITQSAGFDYPYADFPDFKPGEMWTYSDWNLVRLCTALARVYGRAGYEDHYELAAKAAFFDAIGMEGWSTQVKKDGAFGRDDGVRFVLSLENMGRLGLLALARGQWNGQQLVPQDFVEALETKQTYGMKVNYNGRNDGTIGLDPKSFPECPYGYLTWTNTDGDYFPVADTAWAWGSGAGGTKIMWNRNNGVVFAGAGIADRGGRRGIPNIIDNALTEADPHVEVRSVYFPPPDSEGGWRTLDDAEEIRRVAGLDAAKLDEAFAVAEASTKNGGLLVLRRGWLVYERYFGLAHRDATPNLASCGKSFTSIAVGMLMHDRPDLFPDGLDQKVFTPTYFPPEAFPLSDPRKADIKLGHLLAFSAGIRGNNPGAVEGREVILDPIGPDGWQSMVDRIALGLEDGETNGEPISARTLWCDPGRGYSYASSSIHLASMMLRHVSGMELEDYVRTRLAEPMGWGRFTYAYKYASDITHTPGGGGIAVRATDELRFGYLLLHEGRWGDQQLVPAEYVRHCAHKSPYNPHYPYSLQFNVNTDGQIPEYPRDAYWKSGSGAHMLYVVPSLDLVVWKLAGRDSQYGERDTGVPQDPEMVRRAAVTRGEWKATINERDGQRLLLTKVIEAIVE